MATEYEGVQGDFGRSGASASAGAGATSSTGVELPPLSAHQQQQQVQELAPLVVFEGFQVAKLQSTIASTTASPPPLLVFLPELVSKKVEDFGTSSGVYPTTRSYSSSTARVTTALGTSVSPKAGGATGIFWTGSAECDSGLSSFISALARLTRTAWLEGSGIGSGPINLSGSGRFNRLLICRSDYLGSMGGDGEGQCHNPCSFGAGGVGVTFLLCR